MRGKHEDHRPEDFHAARLKPAAVAGEDRPGWGIEIDERALLRDDYVHWERKLPIRPDGSTGYT
jgi:L-alanine-DL-glutamate epimerase-like enolase superfamily enzyme